MRNQRSVKYAVLSGVVIFIGLLILSSSAAAQTPGQITFQTTTLAGNPVLWRMQAQAGAIPENLTVHLDSFAVYPGNHRGPITVSPDGAWYVFLSERFDSSSVGWAGLTIAHADFQSIETIRSNGQTIHAEGGQATAGRTAVVYTDAGGPHGRDLFIVRRVGNNWSAPTLLTGASPYAFNSWPVLSSDNLRVIFDAGNQPYGGPGTRICSVNLDTTGFQELLSPANPPPGFLTSSIVACHSPAFAPDGSVVFEGQWGQDSASIGVERIWRRPAGGGVPALVNGTFTDDNSPNVLPDGRIISLWLGSTTGNGLHEIKLMDASGQNYVMLTDTSSPFPEVFDIGLGCGPSFGLTSVLAQDNSPISFALQQNYPNPFNPSTVISFQLSASSLVDLKVYNVLGQEVVTLVNERLPRGAYKVDWDAHNFSSGVYFYRLQAYPAENRNVSLISETKKLMLLK